MKFKQDGILRYKYLGLIYVVAAGEILDFILFLFNKSLRDMFLFLLITGVLCIVAAAFNLLLHAADISIDNEGVRCTNGSRQLWSYNWPEIEELKRTHAYRAKAVCVVSKDGTAKFRYYMDPKDAYFQLSKAAKKARACYCEEREDGSFVLLDHE